MALIRVCPPPPTSMVTVPLKLPQTITANSGGETMRSVPMVVLLVAVCVLIVSSQPSAAKDVPVKVTVDGKRTKFDPPAIMRDGKTYVPLRGGATAVGATVKWEPAAQRAVIAAGGKTAVIKKSQGIIVEGRLLIPLRLMGQSLGCGVGWDAGAKTVKITRPQACSGST